MPRRSGRSGPPARSLAMRTAPAPSRPAHAPMSKPAPPPAPAPRPTQPPQPPQPQPQPSMAGLEQPSMFKQMAATAGGVAMGSAVGHVVGQGLSSMFSGSGGDQLQAAPLPAEQQPQANGSQELHTGKCAWEIKQFVQCAQDNADISLCSGFNEAVRRCREASGMH